MTQGFEKPKNRSALRLEAGKLCYGALRRLLWLKMRGQFAEEKQPYPLPYSCFEHKTVLRRELKNVDMWMQENKIVNLPLAVPRVSGIILRPGEIFSYWRLIGAPSKRRGYLPGMILQNGEVCAGTGGGLCQLSNLIFWMTLHTPLTVTERHRHNYDVFPDSGRTQPFGSGATCFYPYGDLMIRNDTQDTYQLLVRVGGEYLEGEWRVSSPPREKFEIVERNHFFRAEFWGGYTRHNELFKRRLSLDGELLEESLVVQNAAVTMYAPLLSDSAAQN